MRRWVSRLMPVAIVLLSALSVGPRAYADVNGGGSGGPPEGGGGSVDVNDCGVYASNAGYGVACRRTETVREILDGDPLVTCNYLPLAAGQPVPPGHQGEAGAWYWKVCLDGIKLDEPIIHGDITVSTYGPLWVPKPPGPPILTARQLDVWNWGYGGWPKAQVEFAPSANPRVGVPTLVALVPHTYDAPVRTGVNSNGQTILVRASVDRLWVWPDGQGTDRQAPVSCPGPGLTWSASMQLNALPADACSFTYQRSSATQPGGLYSAVVQIDWLTEYSTDGGATWLPLPVVSMMQTKQVEVDDVQAVNR